jgi:hypothetical protein
VNVERCWLSPSADTIVNDTVGSIFVHVVSIHHVTSYGEIWQAPRGLPGLCVKWFARLYIPSQHRVDPPCQGPTVADNMLYTVKYPGKSCLTERRRRQAKADWVADLSGVSSLQDLLGISFCPDGQSVSGVCYS